MDDDKLKSLYDFVKDRYMDTLPDLQSDMMYHRVLCYIMNRLLAIHKEDTNGNT